MKKKKSSGRHFVSDAQPEEAAAPPPAEEAPIERLYAAIRQLSEIDRGVILLYLEEKSYREIAEITGTNANNVGVRIKRIKERLRRILDGQVD